MGKKTTKRVIKKLGGGSLLCQLKKGNLGRVFARLALLAGQTHWFNTFKLLRTLFSEPGANTSACSPVRFLTRLATPNSQSVGLWTFPWAHASHARVGSASIASKYFATVLSEPWCGPGPFSGLLHELVVSAPDSDSASDDAGEGGWLGTRVVCRVFFTREHLTFGQRTVILLPSQVLEDWTASMWVCVMSGYLRCNFWNFAGRSSALNPWWMDFFKLDSSSRNLHGGDGNSPDSQNSRFIWISVRLDRDVAGGEGVNTALRPKIFFKADALFRFFVLAWAMIFPFFFEWVR